MEASDDPVPIAEKCLKENLPDVDYKAIDACAKVIKAFHFYCFLKNKLEMCPLKT
jgi:hypothetical protein